jgi:rSAM/selenodomain-associated transferase 2
MSTADTNNRLCKVSIIIPVLREQGIINDLLEKLHTVEKPPGFEVIVVDGSPTHETLDAIKDPGVVRLTSVQGRGHQLNQGAAVANGDILLFLHADTTLPSNALRCIQIALQDEHLVGGAFHLTINSPKLIFKVLSWMIFSRSWLTRVPFGDQAIFLRKQYFNEIHGYKEIPLMEDVELMRRVRKNGGKITLLRERVVTSPRRWECEGVVICTLRNWTIRMLYFLRVHPDILIQFYENE